MKSLARCLLNAVPALLPLASGALMLAATPARALEPSSPATKGADVSTVGSDPYLGPTATELAKLEQLQAAAADAPAAPKAPAVGTMFSGGVHALTDAEQAKLDLLLSVPVEHLDVLMPKLALMPVPRTGIPVLTPAERAKRDSVSPPAAPPAAPGSGR